MKTLRIIGKVLGRRIKSVCEMFIVIVIAMLGICLCSLPGVAIAAIFFGTTKEILIAGGVLFISACGLVMGVVDWIKKFRSEVKAEKNKFD